MSNYNTTVQYFRVNANNTAIATSNSGNGQTTEEIIAPVVGGTFVSNAGPVVTGAAIVGGNDFTALSPGQYLYYTDNTGTYILVGQIETVDSATQITLFAAPLVVPPVSSVLSGSFALITNTEPIYLRIATQLVNSTVNIPDFTTWRSTSNVTTGTNNPAVSSLQRVSNVGVPVSTASPVEEIPFTIQTMNQFTTSPATGTSVRYFPTTASFPSYIWIRITPAITNNSLSSKTMYRLTTQESILALNCDVNTSLAKLQGAGYNISSGITAQDSGNVGQGS
jgi:hypothetical protein